MNNATSPSSPDIQGLIQKIYIEYIAIIVDCGILALLSYTTILAIPQEIEYMWKSPKRFSIPIFFYVCTRYGSLIGQAVTLRLDFFSSQNLSFCNNVLNIVKIADILEYIGVQGLLIARAYSLCQENKVVTGVFAISFCGGLAAILYDVIVASGCSHSSFSYSQADVLVGNVCSMITDLLVFGICIWKVWDTWKLKRSTGIQSYNDLVSVLLSQTVLRFCFVAVFSTILLIFDEFKNDSASNIASDIQHCFSTILLADFTLDLRQKNSAAIQASNITLPTIRLDTVASYIHQSILVEMGDREIPAHGTDGVAEDRNSLATRSPDVEIGQEESA